MRIEKWGEEGGKWDKKEENEPGHIVVLIAKSNIQKERTPKVIDIFRCSSVSEAANKEAIVVALEKVSMPKTVARRPPTINGRRRPKRLVQRSLRAPITGAMIRPDIGPAIQTAWLSTLSADKDFSK